jgi:hypothetical protein
MAHPLITFFEADGMANSLTKDKGSQLNKNATQVKG